MQGGLDGQEPLPAFAERCSRASIAIPVMAKVPIGSHH